jgi:RND family efflux transporter MFP subunit
LLAGLAAPAAADSVFTVATADLADEKAVFATVESPNVVPARARIGGTVAQLSVQDGDEVAQGEVIAVVGDEKLLLQISSLDAQIAGLQAQLSQAQIDFNRADTLYHQGSGPKTALDQARTTVEVTTNQLRARIAERAVVQQQQTEGQVLAPAEGRVLQTPVTRGTVVLAGDTIATVADRSYVLRLRVPERHSATLKVGDRIRADLPSAEGGPVFGTITLVYPRTEDGRVVADATVVGVEKALVGERIRVWIAAGSRPAIVIPASLIKTRFGLDYVRLKRADGSVVETPVQRGRDAPSEAMADGIEILSGLRDGDALVKP